MTGIAPVPSDDTTSGGSGAPDLGELFRRSARGDENAFAAVYDATAARVHGLVLRVIRDPAQAEEVTQETFLEAWRIASRFDPDRGSALSWLLTLAHRRAVDRVRSAEAASRRDGTYHDQNITVAHDSTAEAATTAIEAQRVRSAMKTLTDVQREAIGSRTSADTHTRRWPRCWTCRSARPRPGSGTVSSVSAIRWGWRHE